MQTDVSSPKEYEESINGTKKTVCYKIPADHFSHSVTPQAVEWRTPGATRGLRVKGLLTLVIGGRA